MASSEVQKCAIRTVAVRPPETGRETQAVVQAAVAIAVFSVILGSLQRGGGEAAAMMTPYQVLFRDQPAEIQRVYGELLSALETAIDLRTPQDEWPSVAELAEEFVAPFVRTPGIAQEYSWECRRRGDVLNYLGRPAPGSAKPAFLLLLQENVPHPGNTLIDEFHRKLPDGTLLHVGVWFHMRPKLTQAAAWMPEREGWTEVIRGATSP